MILGDTWIQVAHVQSAIARRLIDHTATTGQHAILGGAGFGGHGERGFRREEGAANAVMRLDCAVDGEDLLHAQSSEADERGVHSAISRSRSRSLDRASGVSVRWLLCRLPAVHASALRSSAWAVGRPGQHGGGRADNSQTIGSSQSLHTRRWPLAAHFSLVRRCSNLECGSRSFSADRVLSFTFYFFSSGFQADQFLS